MERQQLSRDPKGLARMNWADGLGLESNPFPQESQEYRDFMWQMHEMEHQDLLRMLSDVH